MAEQDRTMGEASGSEGTETGTGSKVKEAAHQAQDKVSHLAASAREKSGHLAEEGKERAQEMAHRAGDRARTRADEERTRLAGGIRTVADALRRGTDDLPEDRRAYGRMMTALADRADGLSRYLEEHDVDEMTREARRFAREHTGMVMGGAFALGLLGARFLKSSEESSRRAYGPEGEITRYDTWGGAATYPREGGYGTSRGYERPGGYAHGEVYHAGAGELGRDDRLEHGGDGLGTTEVDLDEGRRRDRTLDLDEESGPMGGPGGGHA